MLSALHHGPDPANGLGGKKTTRSADETALTPFVSEIEAERTENPPPQQRLGDPVAGVTKPVVNIRMTVEVPEERKPRF